jgi:rhomboid protease GluP
MDDLGTGNSWKDWQQRHEQPGFAAPEILPPISTVDPARPHDWSYQPPLAAPAPAPRRRSRWNALLRWQAAPATYLLVFANVMVFLLMLGSGAQPLNVAAAPSPQALMDWGAKSSSSVLVDHEWWRLFTAMFIHAGVLHLATNMWCLWNLGLLGEPMLGPLGMGAVYLLTGVAGNLLGLGADALMSGVQGSPLSQIPSVGASGAVFGIAGLLIIFLKSARLPIAEPELRRLRRSVIFFAVINFVLGAGISMAPTDLKVDNMAHLGGFLMGLGLGVAMASAFGAGRQKYFRRQGMVFLGATVLLAAVGFGVASFWGGA